MQGAEASALLIDAVIAFTVLEGALLALHHRLTRRGLPAREYAANLVSGLCLMAALRSAVHGAPWPLVALWMSAAGLVHALDLWRRWRAH